LKNKILDKLKINPYNPLYQDEYLNFNIKYDSNINNLVKISNYDYLLDLSEFDIKNTQNKNYYIVSLDTNNKKLSIYKDSILYEEYDLDKELDEIYEKHKNKITNNYNYIELDKAIEIEKT